ncbi:pollen-specific leucine-rich repeat extensin-like protein 1 [Thunnus maccoyii]|uniref:pollen-specific leucine-rich repeat extensin-like protein 1 n=1 Tax=Thunnus maccoyii TaxID=8240 RepID=UPI001C4C5F2F|nr:pollen-specific leucine-rich repeat extensin-like protein 1 [Thunnus maccoyii]
MAFNGPPVEEHLLARVRRWFNYYAGGPFWPFNHSIECPDTERPPEEDGIIRNLPVPHDDHERNDGHRSISGEARVEDSNHNADENSRPPSPPHQQFPPQHFGMNWQQWGPAVPDFPGPYPVLYAYPHPHAHPFAFPHDAPAFLHAALAFHHAYPFAFPFPDPYEFLHAAPAFPHDAPTFHPAFPHAAPAFPPAFHHIDSPPIHQEDPDDVFEVAIALYLEEHEENEDPEIDVVGLDDEDGIQVPEVCVENIGSLSAENCFDKLSFCSCDSSLDEAPVFPSTSGLSSSTRRNGEENDSKEATAKRLRWSDDNNTD